MEGVRGEAQWIVMMGFLVSIGIFFLALIISQSTLVGQTTAEGVLEFPKNDIQDLRGNILEVEKFERMKCRPPSPVCEKIMANLTQDLRTISLYRKSSLIWYNLSGYQCSGTHRGVNIHYNNGVTIYNETAEVFYDKTC